MNHGVHKLKPKDAVKLIYGLFISGFILILLNYVNIFLLPLGILVEGLAVVCNLLFFKCPHCGRHLGQTAAIIVSTVEKGLMINCMKLERDIILKLNELTFCALRI